MAGLQPQQDDWLKPEENRELDGIMNDLVFGRDHVITRLDALTARLYALCMRASEKLVPDAVLLSSHEVRLIVDYLEEALSQFTSAQAEIDPLLRLAERKARRSLSMTFINAPNDWFDSLSSEELQQLIDTGRQSNLWMRVAHRRTNAVVPPAQAGLESHALAAEHLLGQSILHWKEATNILSERLKKIKESLEAASQTLATIFYRTSTRNRAIQEVHRILSVVRDDYLAINDTAVEDFKSAISRLQNIQWGVVNELNLADVQV